MKNLVSPLYLWMATTAVFMISFFFPGDFYEKLMGERYYMGLNYAALFYYFFYSSFFIIGFYFSCWLMVFFVSNRGGLLVSPVLFLGFLFFVCLVNFYYTYANFSSSDVLIGLLVSQQGYLIKESDEFKLAGGLFNIFAIGFFWIGYYFYRIGLLGNSKRFSSILLVLLFLSVVVASIVRLTRGELIPLLVGMGVIFFYTSSVAAVYKRYFYVLASFILVVLAFVSFSGLRGEVDYNKIISDILAYTVASYNRLALLINGQLDYAHAGKGLYISSFVSFNLLFNDITGFSRYMDWPGYLDVWRSEFDGVSRAGLNGDIIWITAPGYVYLDFGWFAFVFALFSGLMYGVFWKLWVGRYVLGLVVYPWMAFCLLFWFGTNYIFDTKFVVFLITALCFSLLNCISGIFKNTVFFTKK